MNSTKQSAIKAAKRFLELKGFEIIDESWARSDLAGGIDIVASDLGEVVFVNVTPGDVDRDAGFREEPLSNEQFELLAVTWLGEHIERLESDFPVRLDRISVLMLSESRAVIRHHVNAVTGPFASM